MSQHELPGPPPGAATRDPQGTAARRTCHSLLLPVLAMLAAGPAAADEVDDLLATLRPPERFAAHNPAFTVTKQAFTFEQRSGPETLTFWVIKDGDRHVALIPLSGFHSGTIYVLDFRPGHAPKELRMPPERWHIDTSIGSELRTNNFIPQAFGATEASYAFHVRDDGALVLKRHYTGRTIFDRWAHRTKNPVDVDATNTAVLKVDARLGYVVEATYDIWTAPPPKKYEFASAATSGRYLLWPGEATCYRYAITPPGAGYSGYACNHGATLKYGGRVRCRDGGFVAYLNDETGWSPTTTIEGAEAKLVVCGAHTDHDFVVNWPATCPTRDDGLEHFVVKHRLLALPPELTRHVWDTMDVLGDGETRLMVRFGVVEDFEDQPLPLTGRGRGMPWNATVTTEAAHSGKKAIVFTATAGHGDPQVVLKPNTAYRIEAWMKVEHLTAEEVKANEAKARAALEKRRRSLRKKIERQKDETKRRALQQELADLPAFTGLAPPEAYVSGWFYEWSPHSGERLGEVRSNLLKPGSGWKKVSLRFTTPAWGPFIQLQFHATNCRAYLDDFHFRIARGAAEAAAGTSAP